MIRLVLAIAALGAPAPKSLATVTIKAPDLEVFNKPDEARRAVWKGGVVATRVDAEKHLDARLRCDQMVAFLAAGDRIEKATCDGHVHAEKGENWVTGEHAEFDNEKGVITVTGSPHGKQGANEVRGEKIIFYVDENKLQIVKPISTTPGGEKALERTRGK
jgi:lipopolysaccharide export system protein LptA